MDLNKNIVLIGMMGSGKSTIGNLLSSRLDLKFFDIDIEIEKKLGLKIKEIFEIKGEDFFRKIEEKTTIKLLNDGGKVISLGGGGFLNRRIRKEIIKNHLSFWLNWKSSTIINRIIKSKKRPLLKGLNEEEIKKIIIKRIKFYEKANYKINCEDLSKNMLVKQIMDLYASNKN
tara:strand:+ start:23 stop:541 length:519 start_codon:yes stop_codon:yes gene_type:complete